MKTIKRSFKLLGLLFFLLASCQSESDFSDALVDTLAETEASYKVSADLASQIALSPYGSSGSNYNNNLKMITGIR
ncbi:hypothetical protein [Algoriphagus marinus]|uniref:hypothetical protein n=1 Tax=Algoriphagus marinus TaxID=1925762 RepID=UPI00094B7FD8|nr:hypothetical protein [Algoriphagus marinus]